MGAMLAGVVVEPKRSTSLPFLSTRNLVKFLGLSQLKELQIQLCTTYHLIEVVPATPPAPGTFCDLSHANTSFMSEPLTLLYACQLGSYEYAYLLSKREGDTVVDLDVSL